MQRKIFIATLAAALSTAAAHSSEVAFRTDAKGISGSPHFGLSEDSAKRESADPRIEPTLLALHSSWSQGKMERGRGEGVDPTLRLRGETVLIDAVARGRSQDLLDELKELGLREGATYGRWVSGRLPVAAVPRLTECRSLQQALASRFIASAGAVDSQGDVAQGSDQLRNNTGVDGNGVTVGALSDSYDCLGGAAGGVASGDLPAGVQVLAEGNCLTGTDEGRAMLEIVHDVAPGADLAFHTSSGGVAVAANGIEALAFQAGAEVIVDDFIYFVEPFFQDGFPISAAVENVVDNGVTYVTAAGNEGRFSYESRFQSSGATGLTGEPHDFDPGPGVDLRQQVGLPTGETTFILQWSDPYFSISGGAGAQSDLDIHFFTTSGVNLGIGSTLNNVGADPFEIVTVINNGPPAALELAIELKAGPAPKLLKYIALPQGVPFAILEWDTQSPTIYGHRQVRDAITVGAARYDATPAFGVTPPVAEAFSSAGPGKVLFRDNGFRTYQLRRKPELTGPNGANNTFFGVDYEGDGLPNFFGTSAAAPHVAGAAALALDGLPFSPSGRFLKYLLISTTVDTDDPATPAFDTGYDDVSGYGLIDANQLGFFFPYFP